ncbi:hypothetical protein ALO51_200071 [Pseudomonas amygdali]|nr:hypothetical protein ALO51_200071 [Pseudomonas amygdali]
MQRKYVTEFALGYLNSYSSWTTAHQLMLGGKMEAKDQENLSKCHIYIIAARPAPYFKADTIKHSEGMLSGTIGYRIEGVEHEIPFEGYPWKLAEDAVKIECKYPFREVISYNDKREEITFVDASHMSTIFLSEHYDGVEPLGSYQVLYVGQAFGQGNRSAPERLRSHSTLQKILASTGRDYPDKEIAIFMYQFDNDQVFTSMDGRAKGTDVSYKNETRLINAMQNPPSKQQKIGMIEAALIRYFQPHYNEIFKIKFPSTKHKILKSCYDLDVTSLVVELDCTDLNYSMYSATVKPKSHHIAKIDLVASQKRLSFFNATGFVEMADVIK